MQFNFQDKFLDYLSNNLSITILTLGPNETTSCDAYRKLKDYLKQLNDKVELNLRLFPKFKECIEYYDQCNGSCLILLPVAFKKIDEVLWNKENEILTSFTSDTPRYGIASKDQLYLTKSEIKVASINVVASLYSKVVPNNISNKKYTLIDVESTAHAAEMLNSGLVDLAITNELSVKKYNLEFISEFYYIEMLWVLVKKKDRLN